MRTVYLINLSFGLAGMERRFANIWHTLRARGNVRPILVVPDTLAEILYKAKLATPGDETLWIVKEPAIFRSLSRLRLGSRATMLLMAVRSRFVARRYGRVWDRIRADADAVIHVGLNCSGLNPPPGPIVYEAVDANLTQLGSRHYIKAAGRRSVIHCQTERIREALERGMAYRKPLWTTVSSPCYFASYPVPPDPAVARDPRLVAFVGRLAPEKNPLLFVEALGRLREAGVAVRGLILGEGPLHGEIATRLNQLNLASSVELGFSQHPGDKLLEAAVSVSLQGGDNYGSQSLLESMGAGCAMVASDVGETRRLIRKDTGLLIGLDVDQLTTALTSLLADPAGTAAKGSAGAHLVRTQYNAEIYCAFLEKLYVLAVERYESASTQSAVPPVPAESGPFAGHAS